MRSDMTRRVIELSPIESFVSLIIILILIGLGFGGGVYYGQKTLEEDLARGENSHRLLEPPTDKQTMANLERHIKASATAFHFERVLDKPSTETKAQVYVLDEKLLKKPTDTDVKRMTPKPRLASLPYFSPVLPVIMQVQVAKGGGTSLSPHEDSFFAVSDLDTGDAMFAIRVSSFSAFDAAKSMQEQLSQNGFMSYVERISGHDLPYEVRIGPYHRKADAEFALAEVKTVAKISSASITAFAATPRDVRPQ